MTPVPPSPPVAAPGPARLEDFFNRVRATNPFTDNRINSPADVDVDVDHIHQAAFERLVALAQEAHAARRGLGAVLWGEAGIGKSHLLSRLARWADQEKHAAFVYLHNLQASPDNLPRSLLKAVLSILTGGRVRGFEDTLLYRLARAAVRAAVHADAAARSSWDQAERAYGTLIDRLSATDPARAALVERAVYDVLFRFFRSTYLARTGDDDGTVARLAVRWLAGDALDPAEARRLSLPLGRSRDAPVALADNQQIKQVLLALSQLALYRRQSFLLCFDQVDNLDEDQVAALARFLEAVLDGAPNLLVVTAGVQATLVAFRAQVIQASAWDRLAQFEIGLHRIRVPEGRQLVAARLRRALESFLDLEPVQRRVQEDPLFPLGRAWFEEFLQDKIDVRPRDVINWAREGWRREQEVLRASGGPAWLAGWGQPRTPAREVVAPALPLAEPLQDAIDRKVAQKIDEHQAQRQRAPHTLPPDADNLSGLVYLLLEQCRQAGPRYSLLRVERLPVPSSGPRSPYDLLIRRQGEGDHEVCLGLLVIATASAHTTTTYLRRLVQDNRPPDRLLLVTDERRPLPLGPRGHEYLEALRRRGTCPLQQVELTFAHYAELDALQALVGLARSGDLEVEVLPGQVRRVNEKEVIESHHRQGRYLASPLLREILMGGMKVKAGEPVATRDPLTVSTQG
jgi:hypothetical protein